MSDRLIVPIVEGHSEVESIPILLRRILSDDGLHQLTASIARPFRVKRYRIVKEGELEKEIKKARYLRPGCKCILVILDSEEDCPAELGPRLLKRAEAAHSDLHICIVLANREFEAWFLGSMESLRGSCGIRIDATFEKDPEGPRDAKGRLSELMTGQRRYSEVVDQPRLISVVDLQACHNRCPSFRKFARDAESLFRAVLAEQD